MQQRHGVIEPSSITQQVYEDVRARILDGSLAENARLPSEPETCREYNVSRTTVREAYLRLQQEGIVEVRRGSGRYIVPGAAVIMKGSASLLRSMRGYLEASGYHPTVEVLGVERRTPTDEEAMLFGPKEEWVIEVARSYVDDGDLLTYSTNVLAETAVADWESIDWSAPMQQITSARGFGVKSIVIDVSASTLPSDMQERYATDPAQPWLRTTGSAYDHRGRPAWWSIEFTRGDVRSVRIVNQHLYDTERG